MWATEWTDQASSGVRARPCTREFNRGEDREKKDAVFVTPKQKWQFNNDHMLNSQVLPFISFTMFLNVFFKRPSCCKYFCMHYTFSTERVGLLRAERAVYYWCSTANYLLKLNWHNHTDSPDHRATILKTACRQKISPPWPLFQPGHRSESPGDQRNTVLSDSWGPRCAQKYVITK